MKRATYAIRFSSIILALIICQAFSACVVPSQSERGNLIVQIRPDSGSRSVYPFEQALANIHHYSIILEGPDGTGETINDVRNSSLEKSYLTVGAWRIEAIAYNENNQVLGRGENSCEIKASSATKISVIISPSGEGTLALTVDWTGNSLVTDAMTVEGYLLPEGMMEYMPIVLNREGKVANYSGKVGSGSYSVLLKLKDSKGTVLWGQIEAFHLYEDLTTSKIYNIQASEMNSAPERAPVLIEAERGHDRISLRWDEGSARAERYILERKAGESDWDLVATMQFSQLQWTDYNLAQATIYQYRIKAENYFGTSAWSSDLEVKTLPVREVGGLISGNATWTPDAVYHITNNMKVPAGITLKVMPGTKVMIDSGLYLQVEGELVARGLPEAPILFGYGSNNWSYITFIDKSIDATYMNGHYQSGSALQYVMIRGGGRIGIERARPFIEHIDIAEVTSGHSISIVLDGDMSEGLKITKSRISANYSGNWGIQVSNSGKISIEENEISGQYGIVFDNGRNPGGISKNTIRTRGNGIWIGERYNDPGDEFKIMNNKITSDSSGGNWEGAGIGLGWANHQNVLIEGNDISNKEYGILLGVHAISGIMIKNNKISSCRNGGWFTTYYANSNPAVVFEGNSIVDSLNVGQYFNFNGQHSTMWQASGNYFDNPQATWEVQLGEWMRSGETVLNLGENYWGTNDMEAVKQRIFDASRDFVYGTVAVDPVKKLYGIKVDLLSPAHEAVPTNTAVELGWKAIGRAASYDVQVSSDTAFGTVLGTLSGITDTSLTLSGDRKVPGLRDGGTYYWRVSAKNAAGVRSSWSTVRSFTVGIPSALPTKPVDNDIQYDDFSPTLAWEPPSIEATYRVQVDDAADFATPLYDAVVAGSTEYSVPQDLTPEKTYYWRVYVIDANGVQAANPSAVQRFVLPKPGLVTMLEDRLPKAIELRIDGPEKVRMSGGGTYGITVNVTPQKVRWMVNGSDAGTGTQMSFPAMRKGIYPLTVMIMYQDMWYATTRYIGVVTDGEAIP